MSIVAQTIKETSHLRIDGSCAWPGRSVLYGEIASCAGLLTPGWGVGAGFADWQDGPGKNNLAWQ